MADQEQSATSSGSLLPAPPPSSSPKWTVKLRSELIDSILPDPKSFLPGSKIKPRVFQVDHKSVFGPLKVFACYVRFCKRAFDGSPPEWCTTQEFEKQLLELIPPSYCVQKDGSRALF